MPGEAGVLVGADSGDLGALPPSGGAESRPGVMAEQSGHLALSTPTSP